jgi:hypothetical protein
MTGQGCFFWGIEVARANERGGLRTHRVIQTSRLSPIGKFPSQCDGVGHPAQESTGRRFHGIQVSMRIKPGDTRHTLHLRQAPNRAECVGALSLQHHHEGVGTS